VLDAFREVVIFDDEFTALPGERPDPVCQVAHELRSGRRFRLMRDKMDTALPICGYGSDNAKYAN
jgi:DNA polymerase I